MGFFLVLLSQVKFLIGCVGVLFRSGKRFLGFLYGLGCDSLYDFNMNRVG